MSFPGLPPEPPDPANPAAIGLATVTQPQDTAAAVASGMLPAGKPRSTFRRGLEVFVENKLAVAGVGIFVFMLLFCFVGPLIYRTNQLRVNFGSPVGSVGRRLRQAGGDAVTGRRIAAAGPCERLVALNAGFRAVAGGPASALG